MRSLTVLLCAMFFLGIAGCERGSQISGSPESISEIPNVSLDSDPSSQEVILSRDIEAENGTLVLADNSSWIKHLRLKGNKVSFDVEENPNITTGHRFDTIYVMVSNIKVGSICVTQARRRKAYEALEWCTPSASYYKRALPELSGKELTKFIYNLEKSTNGADSYRNYPAFAYCIEMNHDPEHDMEWHLPLYDEVPDIIGDSRFVDDYYWTASGLRDSDYALVYKSDAGTTSRRKVKKYNVYAFRNGSDK